MTLQLESYRDQAREAIKAFWGNREIALKKLVESGNDHGGARGAVVGGKNLDGFIALVKSLVIANGLPYAKIHVGKGGIVLPGYFRPTKQWDLLVMNGGRLIAAVEFKSQVGSFGNNYNNRTEEAIGTAHCFWTAYRENVFGKTSKPFIGWLMVVEDALRSQAPVRNDEPHFGVAEEFRGTSYLQRYDLLCQKLVKEQLYTAAALLATPSTAAETGEYRELSALSGLELFVTTFAGHIAAEAARSQISDPWREAAESKDLFSR